MRVSSDFVRRACFLSPFVLALLAAPEAAYWIAGKTARATPPGGSCAVLVLGFPPKSDGTPHPVARSRVDVGAAIYHEFHCDRFVVSGGSARSKALESDVMGMLALERRVAPGHLFKESKAANTWENIKFSIPHVANFKRIYIVSESLHALRGKRYLCRQRTDLCALAEAASDYGFMRLFPYKFIGGIHEGITLIKDLAREYRKG